MKLGKKPRPDVGHVYMSTACYHQLHEQCRKECKFCPATCRCECHGERPDTPDTQTVGRVAGQEEETLP